MQQHIDDRDVGWLALIVAVEDERVLPESPSATVVQTPEGHPIHRVFMLEEDRKQTGVRLGLRLEVLCRRWRTGASPAKPAAAQLSARGAADCQIQFRNT